ncbi:MAG TPA: MFS transporter [Anaerolineaceae bacterium]|nr:MFS transporter [Anaerolineaceae bacterium]
MRNSRLLTIFLIVFVDLLGFSLILPQLPYYAESFGAIPVIIGLLVASYAAAQLIGAPLLGRLSDRIGRRPVLLLSVTGTFLGFILLGLAVPLGRLLAGLASSQSANAFIIAVLFFSRILDGLTGGNLTVAQAYITDVTDEANRAKSLGLIGAAFGLGFILGPAAGGVLSQWGYNVPAFTAALVSALNLLAIFFFLPESLTPERRENMVTHQRPPFTFKALLAVLSRPNVGPLLHVRLFYGLAFATFQSIFSLFAQSIGLSSQTTGFVLAYVGLLAVITQAGLIGPLTRRFRETWLITTGLWVMGISLLAWAFTTQLWPLLVVILPLALSGGMLNTVIQSSISKSVSQDEVGGILGISTSLEALTRVFAPTVGGFLLGYIGRWAPGIFTAILMAWAVSFTYRRIIIPTRRTRSQAEVDGSHA